MVNWGEFADHMNWGGLLDLLLTALASLFCITVHELSHGLAAWRLGDPTAKNAGRLSLNPIKHIDPLGLVMLLVAHVGWAKPVPVDMRHFKRPKRDMALTALAGPGSNLLLALLAVALFSLLLRLPAGLMEHLGVYLLLAFLANVAILSVGLGLFNLIPISPLDGSKALYALLPDKVYRVILRYERYVMALVLALTFFGVFSKPLGLAMTWVLSGLCALCGLPNGAGYLIALSDLFQYIFF